MRRARDASRTTYVHSRLGRQSVSRAGRFQYQYVDAPKGDGESSEGKRLNSQEFEFVHAPSNGMLSISFLKKFHQSF